MQSLYVVFSALHSRVYDYTTLLADNQFNRTKLLLILLYIFSSSVFFCICGKSTKQLKMRSNSVCCTTISNGRATCKLLFYRIVKCIFFLLFYFCTATAKTNTQFHLVCDSPLFRFSIVRFSMSPAVVELCACVSVVFFVSMRVCWIV